MVSEKQANLQDRSIFLFVSVKKRKHGLMAIVNEDDNQNTTMKNLLPSKMLIMCNVQCTDSYTYVCSTCSLCSINEYSLETIQLNFIYKYVYSTRNKVVVKHHFLSGTIAFW